MADLFNSLQSENPVEEQKKDIQNLQGNIKDVPSFDITSVQRIFNNEQQNFINRKTAEEKAGPENTPSYFEKIKKTSGLDNHTELNEDEWNSLRNAIVYKAENSTLDEAEEESYRMAGALELARKYEIEPKEALDYLESYCRDNWGELSNYKSKYKAIKDSFTLGNNTLELAKLGKELSLVEATGDEEKAKEIYSAIQALEQYNATLQDSMPRSFWMKALEAGAQTLPYTAAVAFPSVVTGIVAPTLAPIAGFAAGTNVTYGTEYIQLRKDGCSENVARGVALASGAIQSVIEQSLGTISNTVGHTLTGAGGKALKDSIADKGIEKLTQELSAKVFAKMHFGSKTFSAAAKGLMEYGRNITEEGAEEFLQNMTSWTGEKIAEVLSESSMNTPALNDALKQSWEEFKGGMLGAVILGIPDAGISAAATAKDFIKVRDSAIQAQSKEAFVKQMKKAAEDKAGAGSEVFSGMSEEKITKDAEQIYDNFASERTKAADEKVKELEEIITGQEGTEEVSEGEASGEEIKTETRNEKGGLIIQNTLNDTGDKGTYRAGDNTQEKNNVYGYINYSLDNENNSVEIDSFKMTGNREYLRNELFERFAEDFAGYEIRWNPSLKAAQDIKEKLISRNPRGKDAGLNYFGSQEKAEDIKVKLDVSDQIKKYMPSLSDKERSAAVALLEAGANGLGYNLKEYVDKTFNGGIIFGDKTRIEEAEKTAQDITKGAAIKGAADIREFTDGVRAVIYAGEKADFSTWCHELSHVWRRQLKGKLLSDAEKAFNVKDGKWTRENEENFARSFEKYLYTGKAETNELKELFEKLKDFMRRVYSYMTGDLNEDVKKVYDELFNGKNNIEVVEKESQNETQTEAESRIADENILTPQQEAFMDLANEIEPGSMDATKAKTYASGEDMKWYFEEKNTAGYNERINVVITMQNENREDAIIKNPDASMQEKTEAVLDISGEKFLKSLDDYEFDIYQTDTNRMLYQVVGEQTDSEELLKAKKMRGEGKNSYQIKRETGYEFDDKSNKWFKEIEDFKPSEKITSLIINAIAGGKIGRKPLEIGTLSGVMGKESELFRLYPSLKDTKVLFAKMTELPFNTLFLAKSKNIVININGIEATGLKGVEATLSRGIQDAINSIEGISNDLTEEDEIVLLGIGDEMIKRGLNDETSIDIAKKRLQEAIQKYKNSQANIISRINQARSVMTESARKASLFEGENWLLFQTTEELMEEASRFNTWQEFMEFYTSWAAPEDAAVPEGADAVWFESTWQKARGISPTVLEEMQRENEKERQKADEDNTPEVMDAMFTAALKTKDGMLENFLKKINEIRHTPYIEDLTDEEELNYNEKLHGLKNFIEQRLSHVSILSNAQKIGNGNSLTPRAKQQLISLMSTGGKVRDYRAAYAYIMDDDSYRVDEKDSVENQIKDKAKKYGLEDMAVNLSVLSAEKRNQLADKIENEHIKEQLKNGTLKVNADFDSYIKHIKSIMDENQKKLDDLEEKTKEDYKHLADKEYRDILDVYDRLLVARSKYNIKNDTVARHADKAIKTGANYEKGFYRSAEPSYNTLYRQYADLIQLVTSTADLEKAINRREEKYNLQVQNKARKEELDAVKALKELRKKLVKRAVRKVDFNRIQYDDARLIIAAQRIFMPNLEGGVNAWLGQDKAWARQMWSDYYTDEENRLKIRGMLTQRGTKTALSALKILEKTKSAEEFEKLDTKEKRILYRAMPREDWKYELQLDKLDKENEESIQLPIKFKEITRTVTDKNGKKHNEVSYSPIVQQALEEQLKDAKDALGVEIYNLITKKPFEEWTTEELESYVKRIDDMYVRGRDKLAAKREAERRSAQEMRNKIKEAVQNTGIVINPDDSEEVKKRKTEKINKILGMAAEIKGTAADKTRRLSLFNKVLHGYFDANVRRVARILDNQKEGINTSLLYWEENNAYTTQERNKEKRVSKIEKAMQEAGISVEDLYKTVDVDVSYRNAVNGEVIGGVKKFTVDELLFYYLADMDEQSRGAVRYGCMLDMKDREKFIKLNEKFDAAEEERKANLQTAIENNDDIEIGKNSLKPDMDEIDGRQVKPGTAAYTRVCDVMFNNIIEAAQKLDKKYFDFAKAIQDDYASNFERLSKICIDVFNQPLARVDNYVPLIRLSLSGDTNENRVKADLLAMTAEAGNQAGVDRGFTQKRTYISPIKQMPVEAGLYKTWANSVDRNEHFIAYADYVRTLRRIYTGRDAVSTMQWIEGRYGHGMKNYIQDYINELANPDRAEPSESWEQAVRALRGRTAPAYLSWKLSSIFKQAVTSPAPFIQFMTPLEYAGSCLKMITHPGLYDDAIKEKSVFMKQRRYDPIIDVINEQMEKTSNPVSAAWKDLQSKGMSGLEWIDWACVAPGWLKLYEKKLAEIKKRENEKYNENLERVKEENLNAPLWDEPLSDNQMEAIARKGLLEVDEIEKKAVEYADDCIRLCQPSNRSVDLSPLFKNGSELQRAFLQFTTSLNVIWQNIRYDIPYAVKNRMFKNIAGMIAGYTLAGAALGLLAGDMPDGDDTEDEKNRKIKRLIFDSTTQFTDAVPLIGAAVTSASEKAITGEGMYRNSVDLFPTLTKAVQGTLSAVNGDWTKAFEKYAETVGMYLGAPISGTKEIMEAAGINDKEEGFKFKPEAFLGQRE